MVNELPASLRVTQQFVARVATILVQSNNAYKGPFETVTDLEKVSALNGDYADVYETNTRWKHIGGEWTNTFEQLTLNPAYATLVQLEEIETRVASLEYAVAHPVLTIAKI